MSEDKVLSIKERAVLLQGPDYQTDHERLCGATFVVDANLLFRLYSLGPPERRELLDALVAVDAWVSNHAVSLFINSREREVGLNYSVDDGEADRMLPAKNDRVLTEISDAFRERILPGFSSEGEHIIREQFHNFCHTKEFDGTINDLFTLHEVNVLAHEKEDHVVWLGCPLPPSCNVIRRNHQVSELQVLKGIDCGSARIFHMTEDQFKRFAAK